MRVSAIKTVEYVPNPINPKITQAETIVERLPMPKEMGRAETIKYMKPGCSLDILV